MSVRHPAVWAAWAVSAVAAIQIAPNPVYVVAIVSACAAVVVARGKAGPLSRAFPALLAIGTAFALIRVALLVLTTRGSGPTLFTTPSLRLPGLLGGFVVGGAIDGGVLIRAAAEGLVIVGIMAVCGAFNAVVDHHELLRLVPRAFAEMGVAIAVAIVFVPAFFTAVTAAAEADRARTGGVAVRRGRTRRLAGPVLERALEQAVALAESMDSRGFGRGAPTAHDRRATALGVCGMALIAAGLAVLATGSGVGALLLVAAGGGAVIAGVATASRHSARTRYRPRRLRGAELALIVVVLGAPVVLAALRVGGESTMAWLGDDAHWPPSSVVPLAAIMLLSAPAFGRARQR